MKCKDIHIRINIDGKMLVDFRNEKGAITDIHEYETYRPAMNTIIANFLGPEFKVRKA